jgi:hypothetical protein
MKDIGYYDGINLVSPRKSDHITYQVNDLKDGGVIFRDLTASELIKKGFTPIGFKEQTDVQEVKKIKYIVIHNNNENEYVISLSSHMKEKEDLLIEFQEDLAEKNNIQINSNVHIIIWKQALVDSGNSGFNSIVEHYDRLAAFSTAIINAHGYDLQDS